MLFRPNGPEHEAHLSPARRLACRLHVVDLLPPERARTYTLRVLAGSKSGLRVVAERGQNAPVDSLRVTAGRQPLVDQSDTMLKELPHRGILVAGLLVAAS